MNYATKLALLGAAVLVIAAIVGTSAASATVLCKSAPTSHVCPAEDRYGVGTQITTKNRSLFTMKNGFQTISCENVEMNGTIIDAGSETSPVIAEVTKRYYEKCGSATMTVGKKGRMLFYWTAGSHDGGFRQDGVEVEISVAGVKCGYGDEIKEGVSIFGGSKEALIVENGAVPKVWGGILCANPAKWTGEFNVTSPLSLFVEQK